MKVAIWAISMQPGAALALPRANGPVNRRLYFFSGETLEVDGMPLNEGFGAVLDASKTIMLTCRSSASDVLVLQGRPIAEPVVQHGPFVMNTQDEIGRAFVDYRAGVFGQWDWGKDDPVHSRDEKRFAFHSGKREEPDL